MDNNAHCQSGTSPDTAARIRLSSAFLWLGKGAWTIVDQALFAGSNFLLSVLLARWLSEQDYGAYSIALTVFWMAGTVHTGLISEPMLVFGPGKFKDNPAGYTAFMLRCHAGISLCVGVLLLVAGLVFGMRGDVMLSQVFQALAAAQFFILMMWMLRKACYVRLLPHIAAIGGAIYAVIMLPAAYIFYTRNMLSSWSAIGLLSTASLAASIWILTALRVNPFAAISAGIKIAATKSHITYGRWAAVTGIIIWLPEQLPFIMTGVWHGLDQTAAAKALWNFAMPLAHTCTAISVFLVPVFVRIHAKPSFRRTVMMLTAGSLLVTAAYWILIGLYGRQLMILFYKGRYIEHASSLWLIGAITTVSGVISVLTAFLRATERPARIFWAYAAASVPCLTAGMVFMFRFGVNGALISMTISLATCAAILVYFSFISSAKQIKCHD